MTLRKRIEADVKQMIAEGGFDPNRDAVALAIDLANDPAVIDDIRVSYLVPEIKRVAKAQIKPKEGVREVGGRIQTVESLRAEIEQEIAEAIPVIVPVQQSLTLRIDDLLGMTKVEVVTLKREYERQAIQTFNSAVAFAATTRFLHKVEVRMDELDHVGDVLTRDGLHQLQLTAIEDQHRASGVKEVSA